MTELGAFTFVLHTHLPYARLAGRWPHGEEWLHEAATESYLPLLITLYDLRTRKIPFKLTMSFTPVLLEQLADPTVLEHLGVYLNARVQAANASLAAASARVQSRQLDVGFTQVRAPISGRISSPPTLKLSWRDEMAPSSTPAYNPSKPLGAVSSGLSSGLK